MSGDMAVNAIVEAWSDATNRFDGPDTGEAIRMAIRDFAAMVAGRLVAAGEHARSLGTLPTQEHKETFAIAMRTAASIIQSIASADEVTSG